MTLTFGELSASQILVGKTGLCRAAVKGNGYLLPLSSDTCRERKGWQCLSLVTVTGWDYVPHTEAGTFPAGHLLTESVPLSVTVEPQMQVVPKGQGWPLLMGLSHEKPKSFPFHPGLQEARSLFCCKLLVIFFLRNLLNSVFLKNFSFQPHIL